VRQLRNLSRSRQETASLLPNNNRRALGLYKMFASPLCLGLPGGRRCRCPWIARAREPKKPISSRRFHPFFTIIFAPTRLLGPAHSEPVILGARCFDSSLDSRFVRAGLAGIRLREKRCSETFVGTSNGCLRRRTCCSDGAWFAAIRYGSR
jgi:hypothetical protein